VKGQAGADLVSPPGQVMVPGPGRVASRRRVPESGVQAQKRWQYGIER
jgi:hypothetical protein